MGYRIIQPFRERGLSLQSLGATTENNQTILDYTMYWPWNSAGSVAVPIPRWQYPNLPHRIRTYEREIIRHPTMIRGMPDMKIVDLNMKEVSYTTKLNGEVLVIHGGTPPFTVYYNGQSGATDTSGNSTTTVESPRKWLATKDKWYGFEANVPSFNIQHYGNRGFYGVYIGGTWPSQPINSQRYHRKDLPQPANVSRGVHSISSNEVVLYFRSTEFDRTLTLNPNIVGITRESSNNITYLYYKVIHKATIEPAGLYNKVTLSLMDLDEFFNVDVRDIEYTPRSEWFTTSSTAKEEHIIFDLLNKAGVPGTHTISDNAKTRDLNFWVSAPPDGPGVAQDEAEDRYRNNINGSVMDSIRAIAEANMLTYWNKPDGGVHFEPIVPYAGMTIDKFFDGTIPVKKYCELNGEYRLDPRLEISALTLDTTSVFSSVEVEGYSNVVQADFKPQWAPFATASGQQLDKIILDPALWSGGIGAFHAYNDSQKINGQYDDQASVEPNPDRGFRFRTIEGGRPKAVYYPLAWAAKIGFDPYAPSNLEYTSGDSNWWAEYKYTVTVTMKEQFQNAMVSRSLAQEVVSSGKLTAADARRAVAGFWAEPRNNVVGACLGDPRFELRWKVTGIDQATIRVAPLRGRPSDTYAPFWFPNFYEVFIERIKNRYAKGVKVVQNPFITELGPNKAVQNDVWNMPVTIGGVRRSYGYWVYTRQTSAADHLATWLTFEEFVKSRRVTIRYYGLELWKPRGFIAVALKPADDPSGPKRYDLFWLSDKIEYRIEMRKYVVTEAEAYFIARVAYVSADEWTVDYLPPESMLVDNEPFDNKHIGKYSRSEYNKLLDSKIAKLRGLVSVGPDTHTPYMLRTQNSEQVRMSVSMTDNSFVHVTEWEPREPPEPPEIWEPPEKEPPDRDTPDRDPPDRDPPGSEPPGSEPPGSEPPDWDPPEIRVPDIIERDHPDRDY